MITIDSINLDTSSWTLVTRSYETIIWRDDVGDRLSLNYFSIKPDIPSKLSEIDDLRHFYSNAVKQASGQLVEISLNHIDNLPVIKTIFRFPQQSSGITYIASVTIPFADFSYVVKVQCSEQGVTGIRESILLSEMIGSGKTIEELMPNFGVISDDEAHDHKFPQHPVSRARRRINTLLPSIRFTNEVKSSLPFNVE